MLSTLRVLPGPTALVLVAALAAGSAGCETFTPATCDISLAGNPFVIYTGGKTTPGSDGDFVYMSSAWGQPLLDLTAGAHYALETGLPCAPSSINLYLSFDPSPGMDAGSLAPSSGNEALILGFDETRKAIQIASNSCSEFWLLVTAGVQGSACPLGGPP